MPVHEVCLGDFYIGKYEVTQAQWKAIMGSNPSAHKSCGSDCPVEQVSWAMAQKYVKKLSAKAGREFRLPTEAEWEFAARSRGLEEEWPGTSDASRLGEFAWYEKNSGGRTHPVGKKRPNALGVYDAAGNVGEWCQDRWSETYYSKSPREGPQGPKAGRYRIIRSGASPGDEIEVTDRIRGCGDVASPFFGLRAVLVPWERKS